MNRIKLLIFLILCGITVSATTSGENKVEECFDQLYGLLGFYSPLRRDKFVSAVNKMSLTVDDLNILCDYHNVFRECLPRTYNISEDQERKNTELMKLEQLKLICVKIPRKLQ